MRKSTAWLLNLGDTLQAAVGERQMLHFMDTPHLLDIPKTPAHCRHVIIWRNTILPVIDLGKWLGVPAPPNTLNFVGIAGYQDQPGTPPQYGALLLAAIPIRIQADDDQACALPKQPIGWRHLAMSCFIHNEQAVPILNLPYLFSNRLIAN